MITWLNVVAKLKQLSSYPLLAFKYEIKDLIVDIKKHTFRSVCRILGITLSTYMALCLFHNNSTVFLKFFGKTIITSDFTSTMFQTISGILSFGYIGAYTSRLIVKNFCEYRFGDPDFF